MGPPAGACLATRIPCGEALTAEKLHTVRIARRTTCTASACAKFASALMAAWRA